MSFPRKLIVEQPNYELEFETVQENRSQDQRLYITGDYLMVNKKNKNGRIYEDHEMIPAIKTFKEDYIDKGRAGGELNHSSSPDIDLDRLSHKIISLEQNSSNPNYYVGKSMVLSTPSGKILESLIKDGLNFGMSSKVLGQIQESASGNIVKGISILSIDSVYDPSIGHKFVNGILENREYIIGDDGKIAEAYEKLDKKLAKYPSQYRSEINQYIFESFQRFLKDI
jgi:hypothetical protein